MKKTKEKAKVPAGKPDDDKKEKARRPAAARSANLGFHGRDDEKNLNPEE
jgi:hypothetical protein